MVGVFSHGFCSPETIVPVNLFYRRKWVSRNVLDGFQHLLQHILVWDRTSPTVDCPAVAQDALGGAAVEV